MLHTTMQHVTIYITASSRVLIVVLLDICVLCDVVLCVIGWVVPDIRNCLPTDTASPHTRLGSTHYTDLYIIQCVYKTWFTVQACCL